MRKLWSQSAGESNLDVDTARVSGELLAVLGAHDRGGYRRLLCLDHTGETRMDLDYLPGERPLCALTAAGGGRWAAWDRSGAVIAFCSSKRGRSWLWDSPAPISLGDQTFLVPDGEDMIAVRSFWAANGDDMLAVRLDADGEERGGARCSLGGYGFSGSIPSSPVMGANHVLYVGLVHASARGRLRGHVVALDFACDGSIPVIWEEDIGDQEATHLVSATARGETYLVQRVQSTKGDDEVGLYCFRQEHREWVLRWQTRARSKGRIEGVPAVGGDRVYAHGCLVGEEPGLVSRGLRSDCAPWFVPLSRFPCIDRPLVIGKQVVTVDRCDVVAVTPAGTVRWRRSLKGIAHRLLRWEGTGYIVAMTPEELVLIGGDGAVVSRARPRSGFRGASITGSRSRLFVVRPDRVEAYAPD